MTDRPDFESKRLPDFDEISDHILPAQNNIPLIALGKNVEGKDEPDELSYIEGQKSRNQEDEGSRS
ncbi:hypothetical protein CN378_04180 [Bacillus sp. AFS015802]|uniref:hypothetical protein n=1 Tax=Bacillus sp. AFS015802 TaxID=2033486 RepID=UPI000BF6681B|nr:hypothetical protein [Bacillus sp. AFS015802]PFA69385.1 hypothetical protein CN378_04180 [Bacillus sp. AFS015802]